MVSRTLRTILTLWLGLVLLLPGPALAQVRYCSITGAMGLIDPCTEDGCTVVPKPAERCAELDAPAAPSCCTPQEDRETAPPSESGESSVAVLVGADCCVVMDLGDASPRAIQATTDSVSDHMKLASLSLAGTVVALPTPPSMEARGPTSITARTSGDRTPPEAPLVLRV